MIAPDVLAQMEAYGFHLTDTGGGCTAFERVTDTITELITVRDDAQAPDSMDDDVTIGLYDIMTGDSGPVSGADDVLVLADVFEALRCWGGQGGALAALLAQRFGEELRVQLTPEEYAEAVALNYADGAERNDVCHTHDHADANMIMLDAWTAITGSDDVNGESELDCYLWGAAWSAWRRTSCADLERSR